mmetsp:Transcript_1313/g.4556  ORF Transcript_1313/g.4556 Transcript_1313/m.4556 type:complete len:201 (+) Transcript_1313:1115-1717(+)
MTGDVIQQQKKRRLYFLTRRTTQWHPMLLFSPSESTFSWVFALMFTSLRSHLSSSATLSLIVSLWGDSFGLCAIMVASRLLTLYPISSHSRMASFMKMSLEAPFHLGSLSGNSCPMSSKHNAPSTASVTQCNKTSPSLCATHPRSCGMSSPPMMSLYPGSSLCKSNPCPILMGGLSVGSLSTSARRFSVFRAFSLLALLL